MGVDITSLADIADRSTVRARSIWTSFLVSDSPFARQNDGLTSFIHLTSLPKRVRVANTR
jgi:hypothetical protein